MTSKHFFWLVCLAASLGACREPDRPFAPDHGLDLFVDSDPRGASVLVDGQSVGTTPDTIYGLPASGHTVQVRLDSAGLAYAFNANLSARRDTLLTLTGPLVLAEAHRGRVETHSAAGLRFLTQPSGMLFYNGGSDGGGVRWPGSGSNAYVAGGAPVFAGVAGGRDTVALGPYDLFYHRGRPAPLLEKSAAGFRLEQSTWILPPPAVMPFRTVRGIEVREEIVAAGGVDGALAIRLVFRNVTDRPAYQAADSRVSAEGITYTDAYVGFALDADVGESRDDALGYLPELRTGVIYDGDLRESGFGADASRPAAVGLRVLDAPAGATVVLNGWSAAQDWRAGEVTQYGVRESDGHRRLGAARPDRDYGALRIGTVSDAALDWRILAAAGPLRLEPGDSAALTLAFVIAYPAAGSYTSGTLMRAGDPDDPARAAARLLAPLAERARAAEALR